MEWWAPIGMGGPGELIRPLLWPRSSVDVMEGSVTHGRWITGQLSSRETTRRNGLAGRDTADSARAEAASCLPSFAIPPVVTGHQKHRRCVGTRHSGFRRATSHFPE